MYPAHSPHVRARFVTLGNGVRLRLAESGETDDPPVLLLHGWGASLYMWRDWFAPVAAAGRRVIALDLPGHGLSDKPLTRGMYTVESLASMMREVLELENLPAVDVVAQSMSGTIALELALQPASGIRKMVLVNPACFGRLRLQPLMRAAGISLIDPLLPHLLARWMVARTHRMVYGDPSRVTQHDIDESWAPSQFPSFTKATRQQLDEFRWERPPSVVMAQRLSALEREVLVLLGTRDRLVVDASRYVRELIDAGAPLVLRIAEGGGHAVNEERPVEVLGHTLRFLRW